MAPHHRRNLSAKSAEGLLKDLLNMPQAFPFPPTNDSHSAHPPYLPPPTPPRSITHKNPLPVAYDQYLTSISTFTIPSEAAAQTTDAIREHMAYLCHIRMSTLQHAVLKLPSNDIPSGEWSVAFAPGVLGEGWVVVFAAQGSEFVWCLWPANGRKTESEMVEYFAGLVAKEALRAEEEMKTGDERHGKLYAIVQQALWTDAASEFLGADWRSGEFAGKF